MYNIFINDMGYSEYYKKEELKMNLGKKYKQLFEGKKRSNDSGLLEAWNEPEKSDFSTRNNTGKIDQFIDQKELQKVNNHATRDENNMYEDGEEITVPLKRPINGKREFIATVYKDGGMTSFTFEAEDEEAMEAAGIDTLNDLDQFMQDSMF
jgi:hypothetical protein|tara:strand:- start:95 stop:550 length:456 start_codon:yes stop_codon:yes gene_type:complete